MSRRARICCAPPGPVQSPGSTIRSSTRTPSDVVVPTRRPARSRMWVISRVTVLLPFVPEIETIGIAPIGVADPRRRRRPGLRDALGPAREQCAPGRRSAGRSATARRRVRPGRAPPRSRVSARSAPTHGKVTIQCPGSDERWTATPPRPSPWSARSRRIQATDRGDGVRPVAGRDVGARAGRARGARDRAGRTRSAAARWRPRA